MTGQQGASRCLSRWSIRTSLTLVGMRSGGADGRGRRAGADRAASREPSLDWHRATAIWWPFMRSTTHRLICCARASRVDRVQHADRPPATRTKRRTRSTARRILLDQGQRELASVPRCAEARHRSGAARRSDGAPRDALMHDGVDPEFAALRANDMAGLSRDCRYEDQPDVHRLRRLRLGGREGLAADAQRIEQADAQSNISLMTTLIVAVAAFALVLMVLGIALRVARPDRAAAQRRHRPLRAHRRGRPDAAGRRVQHQRDRPPVRAASSGCRTA